MAAQYIKDILLFDPEGPYHLSGSFGGMTALEMTNQLEKTGKKMSLQSNIVY